MRGLLFLSAVLFVGQVPAASRDAKNTEPAFVVKALQLLYGSDAEIGTNKDTGRAFAIWKSTPAIDAELFPHADPTGAVMSVVNLALPISVGGAKEYLVLTASNPYSVEEKAATNGCHGCVATLGGIVVSEQKGTWKADIKNLHIADLGSWGQVPEGQLVLIGPDRYGVRFDFDDVHQGDTNDWTIFVGVVGKELTKILDIDTGNSDTQGTCADEQQDATDGKEKFDSKLWCYGYSSDMQFVAGAGLDYYDLEVRYTGTDADFNVQLPNGMKITDVSRVETYKWDDGGGYKLTKSVKSKPQNVD